MNPGKKIPPAEATIIRHQVFSHDRHEAHWRINGFRATILIWTDAEWQALTDRPNDAQYYPCGIWCALRLG